MYISENLQYLRKSKGITQEELADKLGVSRQSVSKWENGETYPETDKLLLLCNIFNVSLDGLLKEDLSNNSLTQINKTDFNEIEKHYKSFSFAMAFGVGFIILGVAICVALASFSELYMDKKHDLLAMLSGVSILLFVAISTFIFVFYGIKHENFCKLNSYHIEETSILEDKKAFLKRFSISMACLVSGVLLDVIFLVLMSVLLDTEIINTTNKDFSMSLVVSVFFVVLSFIIFGFVYMGIQNEKYNKLTNLNNQQSSIKKPLSERICGAIMLTAVAIYLIIGFVFEIWHPSWIVFPIGGIICAIIDTIFKNTSQD